MNARRWHFGKLAVIGIPFAWLVLAFLLPFLIVLHMSVSDMDNPAGLVTYADGALDIRLKVSTYLFMLQDELYALTYLSSIGYAAATTVLCLVFGYPFAYFMARARPRRRPTLMLLVMLPFWTSFLLRIYAWKGILASQGLLNSLLLWAGVVQQPLAIMYTPVSLMIGMVYAYLPFMILPLYASLVKMDPRHLEAAADLGATPWQAFWLVTVPLSKSGIVAGAMLVFIPALGEYVIPELLGGPRTLMIGKILWNEFFTNNDWPLASAVTVVAILLILVPLTVFNKVKAGQLGARL
jgi:putrescine transport system permease protein